MTAGLTFFLVVCTSIILYIVPQGRVAYWADWRLWGMSKTDWDNLHINLGFLFLIALGIHIYYNWKPLTAYLKDRARRFKVFTREFNIALAVTVLCTVGSYFLVPPFSWVMALNDYFKTSAAVKYGEPPYGHAELSTLKTFAQKMNLDLAKSLVLLERSGYPVDSVEITLADIARRYRVAPQQVYAVIQSAAMETKDTGHTADHFPDSPPPGTGNLSLADVCRQYHLDIQAVVRHLKDKGIAAAEKETLKTIAANSHISTVDVYEKIKSFAAASRAR